ncbi:MAG: hypothetical protein KAR79_00985 [Simkaniaceae bacterium]|nr:hypothetical protein [Simkaniaceae bacterium]
MIGLFLISANFLNASFLDLPFFVTTIPKWRQDVAGIDAAIDKLTNLKNLELAKAARAQNQGDRLQFNSQNLMDARRYWNDADTSQEIAARYQEEINKLELLKQEILKKHGIDYTPGIEKIPDGQTNH